jgi:outer membrane protein OmpA-like peptidoglycan-associated protein
MTLSVAETSKQPPGPIIETKPSESPNTTPKQNARNLEETEPAKVDTDEQSKSIDTATPNSSQLDTQQPPLSTSAGEQADSIKHPSPQLSNCPEGVTISFKHNSASPDPDTGKTLEKIVDWLNAHPTGSVSVEGHADSKGTDQHNLLLSYRRAQSVVALFKARAIAEERLILRAAGSHNPIKGLPADGGENRRTTVHIIDPPECQPTNE